METITQKPDRLFRALSDETRLRILGLLLTGELCVCDIVDTLEVPQPTVSRHLAYLRKAGLVSVRKEGVWCYYRLVPASDKFEASLHESIKCCAELSWFNSDVKRLKKVVRSCCE